MTKTMSIGWKFSRSATDEGRSGGNPSEYTFDHDLKDFVRETLQNSNDAGQEYAEPTSVTYRFNEFTGAGLDEFLSAIHWSEDTAEQESLIDHLDAVAAADGDTTIGHILREVEEDDRLLVATVEDRNTHGLYGPEGGGGPFSALVLDELITQKEGGSGAGGSYGLGKAVLWSWSGLKTVIFNSVPRETDDHDPPRFIARTQLPTHEADSDVYRYEGHGLFGDLGDSGNRTAVTTDGGDVVYKWGDGRGRPHSVWSESATELAETLGVSRSGENHGTSISVLGFAEPGGKEQPDPNEIAEKVADEASKWFWPAMLRGDLEVRIETTDREIEVEPDTHGPVKPFIRCVQERNQTRETLDQPGDVGVASPTFEIEDKEGSAIDDDDTTTESGPVNVYVRLANPEAAGRLSNQVALIRGAGMVVKYYDRNRVVYGDRTFHGVVLAGKARPWTDSEPTEADEDIDDYLQAAEPPRHDDWEYTKDLKSTYGTGSRTTIQNFQRTLITDAIRDLTRQTREEGRLIAGRLADRLRIPEGRGRGSRGIHEDGGGGSQVVEGTSEISFDHSRDRWRFSGFAQIVEDDYEAWQAEVKLQQLDEEHNVVGTVPIESLSVTPENVYVDDSNGVITVRAGPSVQSIRFRGRSGADPFRGETQLNVKGRVFKRKIEQ